MVRYIVRKPTQEDIEYIIEHIRPEDVAELEALDGSTIREAFDETPGLLENSQVWEVNGKPVCIFGVTPQDGPYKVGIIWLLATDDFHMHTKKFARDCKRVFTEVIRGYGYLFNYIHSENTKSIEWLKWLGFEILDGRPLGHKGATFHKFEMKNV